MKRTKFLHTALAVLLLCATGLCTTACSDSDDAKAEDRVKTEDGKTYVPDSLLTEQERYQLACQSAIMGAMASLAGLETVTPDVVNQTYEPTYGQTLDDENEMVRVVKCHDTDEAEQLFRDIAGLDSIDAPLMFAPTPDGYTLSLTDLPILPDGKRFNLGTLTFHRDGGPRRYGYVEVNIPCIPHLERIDYLSPEAFPDNANSPYMLGDIVRVESGHNLCPGYYVCIANNGYRSTLAHMYHGKTPPSNEAINADGDSEGCWRPYNNDHGHKTEFEDIKDYVSFILEERAKVINIKAFFNREAYNIKARESGKLGHIFPENFNNNQGVAYTGGASAYIYYDGYITDEYAWVPAFNYRNALYARVPSGCNSRGDVNSGNKKYVKDSEWNSWVGSHEFTMNVIHTDRVVDGSTLEFSPTKDVLEMGIPAEQATTDQLGWCYADDGMLYETYTKATTYGHKPLGMLAYVNDQSEFGNLATEAENGYGHGLVMAYNNTSTSTCRYNSQKAVIVDLNDGFGFTQYVNKTTGAAAALTDGNGSEKTLYLADKNSPAAQQVRNIAREAGGTGWILPSTAQWIAMLCGPNSLGKAKMPSTTDGFPTYISYDGDHPFTRLNQYLKKASVYTPLGTSNSLWTSSSYSPSIGIYVAGNPLRLTYYNWSAYAFTRPVFAY